MTSLTSALGTKEIFLGTAKDEDLDWVPLFKMDFSLLFTSWADVLLVVDRTSLRGAGFMVSDHCCPKAVIKVEQL